MEEFPTETEVTVLTDDMLRRMLQSSDLEQQIPAIRRFRELQRQPRRTGGCTPCGAARRKSGQSEDSLFSEMRMVLARLNPTQQQALKNFLGVSRLAIDYQLPGLPQRRRTVY